MCWVQLTIAHKTRLAKVPFLHTSGRYQQFSLVGTQVHTHVENIRKTELSAVLYNTVHKLVTHFISIIEDIRMWSGIKSINYYSMLMYS